MNYQQQSIFPVQIDFLNYRSIIVFVCILQGLILRGSASPWLESDHAFHGYYSEYAKTSNMSEFC